jgi:hypothetical protein
VIAMLVMLAGAGLYAYAWSGMHNLAAKTLVIPKGIAAMRYFDTYWQLSRVAILVMLAGTVAVAWSFWSYSRRVDPSV